MKLFLITAVMFVASTCYSQITSVKTVFVDKEYVLSFRDQQTLLNVVSRANSIAKIVVPYEIKEIFKSGAIIYGSSLTDGTILIDARPGVVILNPDNAFRTKSMGSQWTLTKVKNNFWLLEGDLYSIELDAYVGDDIVIKATAMSLKQHPQVNSQWFDDRMKINHHVHIGVAVAVEEGLLVPVLKFADEQSLTQIGSAVKDFAGRARNKKLAPNEMEGSTFTVSNLGMFGIQEFTSIINQPNSAILSVGAIVQKPVVKEGAIVVGNTMKITLACDHRTVDGATAAAFLQTLQAFLENPVTMLA